MMTTFLVGQINKIYDYVACILQRVCIEEEGFPKEWIYIYYIIPK